MKQTNIRPMSIADRFWLVLLVLVSLNINPVSAQNLPPLEVTIYDSAATNGYYFMIPYRALPPHPYDHPQMILDRFARIVYYWIPPETSGLGSSTLDFKLHPNGMMSYWSPLRLKHFLLDSTFLVVDSIEIMNGIEADPHELLITNDNHFFILGKETRYMNLSGYHWFGYNHTQPGSTNAKVLGAIIQEFDENKNLIWEWKAHDHYAFADVDSVYLSDGTRVDWTHANAVERDADGNILVSLRHFNEITKIDHQNGNIIWRLGGKCNQFTFPNDPVGFTGQHDIRSHPGNHISFFDNGQYNAYSVARGVEYALNESAKTATLVWEYIHDSAMYSTSLGSHRILTNGNHLLDFGTVQANYPWMVVAKPDKSLVLVLDCPNGYVSYRAYNYDTLPWQLDRPEVSCIQVGDVFYLEAEEGHAEYRWSTGSKTQTIPITDTGTYWVFVPYSQGYISSEPITITNLENPCLFVSDESLHTDETLSLTVSPNPMSESGTIRFSIPPGEVGVLSLFDLTGNPIPVFRENPFNPGHYSIILPLQGFPKGLYVVALCTENQRIIRKIALQ